MKIGNLLLILRLGKDSPSAALEGTVDDTSRQLAAYAIPHFPIRFSRPSCGSPWLLLPEQIFWAAEQMNDGFRLKHMLAWDDTRQHGFSDASSRLMLMKDKFACQLIPSSE
jgi:hypothetical protein